MSNKLRDLLRVLAAVVLAGAVMSEALGRTADDLRGDCEPVFRCTSEAGDCSRDEFVATNACISYIHGFKDGRQVGIAEVGAKPKAVCVPDEVTIGQLIRVFLKYVSDHPEKLHEPEYQELIRSWRLAFPCK